jgi:hypothetical protein
MLTIPSEVKALFSSDTVHKNFHVRFPGGEYTDLNNEDIVSESVQFTESLCSQQYFKFGLAEASQIEFVAVGIPNVRGAYIECAIEIDCTRLGDAWAAAHLPDLTLPFLTAQTCFYGDKLYYRVPYGRFKVDACPRNHGAMYQRQITAYSDMLTTEKLLQTFETNKLNTYIPYEGKYVTNLYLLFVALANQVSYFTRPEWTNTELSTSNPSQVSPTFSSGTKTVYFNGDSEPHELLVTSSYTQYLSGSQTPQDLNFLLSVETDRDTDAERAEVLSYIKNDCNIDWERTLAENNATNVDKFLDSFVDIRMFYPSVSYDYTRRGVLSTSVLRIVAASEFDVIYPKIGGKDTKYQINSVRVPYGRYAVYLDSIPNGFRHNTGTKLIKHTLAADFVFGEVLLSFGSTLKQKVENSVLGNVMSYAFSNAFSELDMVRGQLELCGWFLKPDRNGSLSFFQMSDNQTAIAVSASDWSSFWWDETPIDSIGLVNVIYTQDGEEQQQSFNIGDGNSVYTIENNEVLKSAELDETTMQSILTTYFEPNASVVNFTPVELEMRGLPYLESGDYIELTAEDGETVQTYILAQTISGIQHLTASVTSTTGALLEVIDNE